MSAENAKGKENPLLELAGNLVVDYVQMKNDPTYNIFELHKKFEFAASFYDKNILLDEMERAGVLEGIVSTDEILKKPEERTNEIRNFFLYKDISFSHEKPAQDKRVISKIVPFEYKIPINEGNKDANQINPNS